jgi:hypothetical protein
MPSFVSAHRVRAGDGAEHETLHCHSQRCWLQRGPAVVWDLGFDSTALTLAYSACPGVLHYFRLADATLIPLPPEHKPARHTLAPGNRHESPLRFSAGDAYIAVSPGAGRIADSPAVARFLHLRDYFNAEKLAEALLAHLVELAGTEAIPEDVTALVVEAR